jgi:hypothetical protein
VQSGPILLFIQVSQRWCILLVPPQTGHLHRLLTSLSALPAICRCLFLECDVFFLGTAFKMPSQMPSRIPGRDGRLREIAGMASEYLGKNGSDSCLMWSDASLYVENNEEGDRGKSEEVALVGNIAPVMLPVCGRDVGRPQGTRGMAWAQSGDLTEWFRTLRDSLL